MILCTYTQYRACVLFVLVCTTVTAQKFEYKCEMLFHVLVK